MIFPFRSSAIFRNRWIALLWAAGICFAASEIVDTLSGMTGQNKPSPTVPSSGNADDKARRVLGDAPPPGVAPPIDPEAR